MRAGRIALGATVGVVGLTALAVIILAAARGPIAARVAQAYLRRRGVESAITVEAVGPGGFTARARLGPAGQPDLMVERVEVALAPVRGLAAPQIRSIRLVGPVLRARFDGRRLSFGSLQRLVDEALAHPGTGPGPDLRIEGGRAIVSTPAGAVQLRADAWLPHGRLQDLNVAAGPAVLSFGDQQIAVGGASLIAHAGGASFSAHMTLTGTQVRWGGGRAEDVRLAARVTAPLSPAGQPALNGPVHADLELGASQAARGRARLRLLQARLTFDGAAAGPMEALRFSGSARANASADRLDTDSGLAGGGVSADVSFNHLALQRRASGVAGQGSAVASFSAARVALGSARGETVVGNFRAAALSFDLQESARVAAALTGELRAAQVRAPAAGETLTATGLAASVTGRASAGPTGVRAALTGDARALGGVGRAAALRLALKVPLLGADPPNRRAVAGLLESAELRLPSADVGLGPEGLRLNLRRPATVAAASGARVAVTSAAHGPLALISRRHASGGFSIVAAGGGLPKLDAVVADYRVEAGGLRADGRIGVSGNVGPLRAASLHAEGAFSSRAGRLVASVAHCMDASLGALEADGQASVQRVAARLCPLKGAPALSAGPDGWRLQLGVEAARAHLPVLLADVREASGGVEATGQGAAVAAQVEVARLTATDASPQARFRPLRGSGRASLAHDVWTGDFNIATARSAAPLGALTLRHAVRTGVGEAQVAAPHLAFSPDGLQPMDVSPLLAAFGSEVNGSAAFQGRIGWRKAGLTSSGRFSTPGLDFRSSFGRVHQARTGVVLSSLAPFVTAPAQRVFAQRVDWLLPLEDVQATFAVGAQAVELTTATARMAKGAVSLDAISFPLKPDQTVSAVVHLKGVDLGDVLTGFGLGDAVQATARIDGIIPFAAGPQGLRIADGRVFATGPGRLSINRTALTSATAAGAAPGASPNAVQDFAYQALENLAFDQLDAKLQSRPEGRLGVVFHVRGQHDPPVAAPTRVGIFDLLRGRAFNKPIPLPKGTPIELTLDTSVNFDELMRAYQGLNGRSARVQPGSVKP